MTIPLGCIIGGGLLFVAALGVTVYMIFEHVFCGRVKDTMRMSWTEFMAEHPNEAGHFIGAYLDKEG